MDRAIEVLNFYRNRHYNEPDGTEEKELADAINEILPRYAALREQETVTNRNGLGWISVKNDLPKKEGSYVVATKNGGVVITHYYPRAKSFSSRRLNRLVTHWMERPAPPKEGADHA